MDHEAKTEFRLVDECKKVSITYNDRNGAITERSIEPHVIIFKQGLWYVYAFCHLRNDFRFFKTGRIESANILPQSFTRRSYNEEDVPLNFWHQTVEAKDVVLEVEQNCLSDVEEWLGIENFEHKKGKHLAYVKLPYDNGLVTKIISFGSGIKVVQPEDLKEKVKLCAQEIMNNYK